MSKFKYYPMPLSLVDFCEGTPEHVIMVQCIVSLQWMFGGKFFITDKELMEFTRLSKRKFDSSKKFIRSLDFVSYKRGAGNKSVYNVDMELYEDAMYEAARKTKNKWKLTKADDAECIKSKKCHAEQSSKVDDNSETDLFGVSISEDKKDIDKSSKEKPVENDELPQSIVDAFKNISGHIRGAKDQKTKNYWKAMKKDKLGEEEAIKLMYGAKHHIVGGIDSMYYHLECILRRTNYDKYMRTFESCEEAKQEYMEATGDLSVKSKEVIEVEDKERSARIDALKKRIVKIKAMMDNLFIDGICEDTYQHGRMLEQLKGAEKSLELLIGDSNER